MIKNPFLLTAVFFTMMLVGISACKKSSSVTDDPNISHVNLNKLIGVVPSGPPGLDSLDVNGDGLAEMMFVFQNVGGDTGYVLINQKAQELEMAISGISPLPYSRQFTNGESIPTSSSQFYPTSYISYKSSGIRVGLTSGETYLAFRFRTGTKYQYGWMKVSINSAYTELNILEYAYSLQYNTAFHVGAV